MRPIISTFATEIIIMSEKSPSDAPLSYASAGVSIDSGNELVKRIKPIAAATSRPEVCASIGGFAALFQFPNERYEQPILVSATDGVGTKLKLALATHTYYGIGIDLVAMCANDLVVCGAEPLFFLDYYATGKLNVSIAEQVIQSIGEGCKQCNMALIGGETAEMPGMYQAADFDLAGFCVGVVEKSQLIDGSHVKAGDALVGIASSGPHANGYSLIRKILDNGKISLDTQIDGQKLADILLQPTKIYVASIRKLLDKVAVHALAHITGGGLLENIPRVLPAHTQASIDCRSWQQPAIFTWLQQQAQLSQEEMYRTFNCGIGMVACIPQNQVSECLQILEQCGEKAQVIGEIENAADNNPRVILQ